MTQALALLMLAAAVLSAGCGSTSSASLNVAAVSQSSFVFSDERPLDQRQGRVDRLPSGATTHLGDDTLQPPANDLVRAWLQNKAFDRLADTKVVLQSFSVSVFDPATTVDEVRFGQSVASVPGAGIAAVLVARLMIGGIEAATSSKSILVTVDIAVDGKTHRGRASHSVRGRVTESDVAGVVEQALDDLVSDLGPAQ